jgi:hypothetical protein
MMTTLALRCTKAEELKGTYATRAEARRAQQRFAESEPDRHFIIRDLRTALLYDLAFEGHEDGAHV